MTWPWKFCIEQGIWQQLLCGGGKMKEASAKVG
jgi:hypothetical protein